LSTTPTAPPAQGTLSGWGSDLTDEGTLPAINTEVFVGNVLTGPPGAGKSSIVPLVLIELAQHKKRALYRFKDLEYGERYILFDFTSDPPEVDIEYITQTQPQRLYCKCVKKAFRIFVTVLQLTAGGLLVDCAKSIYGMHHSGLSESCLTCLCTYLPALHVGTVRGQPEGTWLLWDGPPSEQGKAQYSGSRPVFFMTSPNDDNYHEFIKGT
jgi:hypothetical protein